MLLEQQFSPKNPIFFTPSSPRLRPSCFARRGDHPPSTPAPVDPSLITIDLNDCVNVKLSTDCLDLIFIKRISVHHSLLFRLIKSDQFHVAIFDDNFFRICYTRIWDS